jgi:hypothetical protein
MYLASKEFTDYLTSPRHNMRQNQTKGRRQTVSNNPEKQEGEK